MKKHAVLLSLLLFNGCLLADVPLFYKLLSKKKSVPLDVIFALAITETNIPLDSGKSLPWPYTININGESEYFNTSPEMIERAYELKQQGKIHFDCGLFQVNWKWNGRHRASSIEEACKPNSNGRIAADILKEYFSKNGSWVESAGKYHNPSNNNGAADAYKRKFKVNLKYAQGIINGKN